METAKIPKFHWGELSELNSGHTPNEWGLSVKKPSKSRSIIAYDVSWKS